MSHDIKRVAVVSTGVIGASWVTAFLARGLNVVATDPAPDAQVRLRATVESQWPAMVAAGLAPGACLANLRFTPSLEEAVGDAQFVQENGPERLDLKRELFARLDAAAPPDAILASSSSSFVVSQFQGACTRHPERVVLGHPFNPPHLIPLVEVVGGATTSTLAIEQAMNFYRAIGKHPIHLRKEVMGHVANRLQAALWQEALHLVEAGVASVADIDAAIAHGPGLRWALLGPFMNLHFSGGEGGIAGLFEKPLWQAVEAIWADLGKVSVGPALAARVAAGVGEETASVDVDRLLQARDRLLQELLRGKCQAYWLP
ncbi:3-hydroxyacyl-CoA dehydrogenase NAD-binding domain-containing protein [Pseudomonas sp. R5(2019)]|uniref:3-hydroxyacyl-CoA dehydrogenase NAD-binding domain-containing protein n=1 Tax=Pseudomonas sp. R5(2019) TaxID=2697566 RepID=UPI0014120714|nr:3-hydroxyacyl-CoA dehydrogenase NAD-binding domain-containing protein [Pseudomonas sp. R5(2019)]NBA97506.1 3-hydroxyacyl-CoA dehydrogenase [Pseudomonas sp. R5(2019)]